MEMYEQIIEKLNDGFEKDFFRACINNLNELDNTLRLSNFAFSLRELFREVLLKRAPDDMVRGCSWFIPKPDDPSLIPRSDRMKYAIQAGLSDSILSIDLIHSVQQSISCAIEQIKILSKYTHITRDIFYSKVNKDELASLAISAFEQLLCIIEDGKREFAQSFSDQIDKAVFDRFFYNTITEIDSLSTHHFVNLYDITSYRVSRMDCSTICFVAEGVVWVQLQYGSALDLKNDQGFWRDVAYPFISELQAPIPTSIDNLELTIVSFHVDVDSPLLC